jgi:dihydrofolate synthase/folylpolyglutamate synthase
VDNRFDYADEFGVIRAIELPSRAPHLRDSAALAIRATRELNVQISDDHVRTRLRSLTLPGRQQLLPGKFPVLLDVAHNPISFSVLAETIRRDYSGQRIAAVIGMMKDKDAHTALATLNGLLADVRTVELGNPRSYVAEELSGIARSVGLRAESMERDAAFEWLHRQTETTMGLVAGSFYLAGDYLKWREHAGIA